MRYELRKLRLTFEATGFLFRLKDALVQRRDLSGADFFVNAGSVDQKGLELHGDYTAMMQYSSILDYISVRADLTLNNFRYDEFVKGNDDFSGNRVPSVPSTSLSLLGFIYMKNGLNANINFYSASQIYLNDANTAVAEPYRLLGARLGWTMKEKKKIGFSIYIGADNLLDEVYSLGNDINAAANRFYNAAPGRNWYFGLKLQHR